MREFIENMPKIELHLHIEGSLEPELMFELAQRNKVDFPFSSVEEIRKAYDFNELQDFLDIYYEGMGVLQTEQDFYDLTMAYLKKIASQNVVHTEIFFDPQGHTSRGVDFDTVLSGITRALDDGKEKFGITSNLIMCFLRHLPETHTEQTLKKFPNEDDAMTTFKKLLASPFRHRVIGVGLDSSELGFPPSIFKNVFALAKKEGLKLVAHAGEEGPPEYVYEAIDILDVDRVDHGNRSLEDPKLVNKLINKNLALTVCPLSNKELCVVNDMKKHPLKKMLELGLKPTVNSDDPSYFGGYMNENFISVANALKLDKKDIVQLAKNAIDASFISADQKRQLHTQLSEYVQSYLPEAPAANSPHI